MEKYDFIKLMLKNRNLSVNDKRRLVLLATQEIENRGSNTKEGETNSNIEGKRKDNGQEQIHAPKDTAAFLSLFNHEDGFKFLTHAYDPDSEMEYCQLLKSAQETFLQVTSKDNAQPLTIPTTLYALMKALLFGGRDKNGKAKGWIDCNRKSHTENYACRDWKQWAEKNPRVHILSNESIKRIIMDFRSTIRLVLSENTDSRLETIIKRQVEKHANLSIDLENLDNNSDFYTYVNYLEKGVKRILDDLSKYSKETPKVKISYQSSREGDYKCCTIKIVQYGSFSTKPLDEVIGKLNGGGGDFFEIKKTLCGYCNWSVESKWNNEALRWNILDDTGKSEIEEIPFTDIPGFTHILTFYNKIR